MQLKRLGIDIETEGILNDHKQSYFHPRKVEVFDRVPASEQILTVALGWREHGQKWGTLLRWKNDRDRAHLIRVLRAAKTKGWWLLGANIMYDIMFMRYGDPGVRSALTPFLIKLRDVLITNYLAYDQRPERSLKTLSHLFGITEYETERTYAHDMDPDLHQYNLQDVFAALDLDDILVEQIRATFGTESPKLSSWSMNWFSDVMWTLIHKQECGIKLDETKVRALDEQSQLRVAYLNNASLKVLRAPLFGKGSQKITDHLFTSLVPRLDLGGDAALEISKETKKISTGKNNLQLFLEKAQALQTNPETSWRDRVWARRVVRRLCTIQTARQLWKLASTYTRPMLEAVKRKGRDGDQSCRMIDGIVYPQWFPIPMAAKDDHGAEGGTVQVRYAAKDPACQTWPKSLKACMTSRFPGGWTVEADQSQMELRMPALLSGDPAMMEAFASGGDFHANMIIKLMGKEIRERSDFPMLRQAGKTFNFGALFGAGAAKLQTELRKRVGITWTLERVRDTLEWFLGQFSRLKAWQEEQVDLACVQQYLMVPFTGHSRTFAGTPAVIRATYRTNILNFPVQGPSAAVVQSAEIEITKSICGQRLKSYLPLNCHDSLTADVHPSEKKLFEEMIDELMVNPPYYHKLCESLGRTVPLAYETDWKGPF